MKMLLITLLTITTSSVFAASQDIVSCHSKYERFTVSVDEDNNVSITNGIWERENGVSADKKITVHASELSVLPNGVSLFVNARESAHVIITMDKVLNNDNDVLVLNLKSDNDSTLSVMNDSLGLGKNGLGFFADECVFSK